MLLRNGNLVNRLFVDFSRTRPSAAAPPGDVPAGAITAWPPGSGRSASPDTGRLTVCFAEQTRTGAGACTTCGNSGSCLLRPAPGSETFAMPVFFTIF